MKPIHFSNVARLALLLAIPIIFHACRKESIPNNNNNNVVDKPDLTYYALTDDNKLLLLNSNNNTVLSSIPITGLESGEKVLSIDFRPATGQLYAVSSTSVLYIVDHTTAKAKIVSKTQFNPKIQGASASIDFNPTVDRLRLVTGAGQNLRLNPETAVVAAMDADINGVGGASIAGVAYTNSVAGASETTLFDIDASTDKLYKQMPPNDGTLVEVGSLGVDIDEVAGFDISEYQNIALAALTVGGENGLYGIDLVTGMATLYDGFAMGTKVISIAIVPRPVAYAADNDNNLHIFNPFAPETSITKAITGLQDMEVIVGLDMRPATGQLYGLGSTGRIYTFNLSSGAASMVGSSALTLTGTKFGFDFNPTVDRIRIVSNTGSNLRVNPNDGILASTDADLNPGTPMVSAAAYDQNVPSATMTTLFVIDTETDKLYKQAPPMMVL